MKDTSQDVKDFTSLLGWLKEHHPLLYTAHDALVSVSIGVVANKSVNADKAYNIGIDLAAAITGWNYADVKLKRTYRIKPMKISVFGVITLR